MIFELILVLISFVIVSTCLVGFVELMDERHRNEWKSPPQQE
jgi:hypothetical protein